MKKAIKLLPIILCLVLGSSCVDLNVAPKDIISNDSDVFTSRAGVEGYVRALYNDIVFEDFKYMREGNDDKGNHNSQNGSGTLSHFTGESIMNLDDMIWDNIGGDWLKAWNYTNVRNVNLLIEQLDKNKNSFEEGEIQTWLGEAYCLRALYYFTMVKRYGGIPIIKEVQNYPEQSVEELRVPRNTEQEVYEFIRDDLNEAFRLLSQSGSSTIKNDRINKDIVLAYKSRTMLYAASIAENSTEQLNGLVGIPEAKATEFYNDSYEASIQLENAYELYDVHADKYENYWNLFLDTKNSKENIFVKNFQYPHYQHSWDAMNATYQMRGPEGYGAKTNPTVEFVEMFDDINGNPFVLNVGTNADPARYANPSDIFKDAEPRLRATIILPWDEYKGQTIEIRKGIYESYPSGKLHTSADFTASYKGMTIQGKSGMGNNETTITGFHLRKYMNPSQSAEATILNRSTQSWIAIRYAEILLNRAEAAFKLGKLDDAYNCILKIRERAGAYIYPKGELTEERIRKERRMELAFESHTYWDLCRWRIFDREVNSKQFTALSPYYVHDEGKYIFTKEGVGPAYTFITDRYYQMIPAGEIRKNPNLSPNNPGY